MIDRALLDEQVAIELPAREMLSWVDVNIVIPIAVQTNVNVQVCGVGYQNQAICTNVQTNVGNFTFNYGG